MFNKPHTTKHKGFRKLEFMTLNGYNFRYIGSDISNYNQKYALTTTTKNTDKRKGLLLNTTLTGP